MRVRLETVWCLVMLLAASWLGSRPVTPPPAGKCPTTVCSPAVVVLTPRLPGPPEYYVSKTRCGPYRVRLRTDAPSSMIRNNGSGDFVLEVTRAGTVVYRMIMPTESAKFGDKLTDFLRWSSAVSVGPSVTGNGVPDVVIYSAAAWHERVRIIELGRTVHLVAIAGLESELGWFLPRRRDLPALFQAVDQTFEGWIYAHYESAFGDVILRFDGTAFQVAPDLMHKPAPNWQLLVEKARLIRQRPWSTANGLSHPPAACVREMVKLIYTGHADLAWRFYDVVWRKGKPGQHEFLRQFKQQLATSHYWPCLKAMNNL